MPTDGGSAVRMIDASGPLENGMWSYGFPHPPVDVQRLPREHTPGYFSQGISMSVQSSTYIECSAHLREDAPSIDQIPLERFVVDAVVLHVSRGADEHVSAGDLEKALGERGEKLRRGDALLVHTGWDAHWCAPDFTVCPPHFALDAIDLVLSRHVSILGSDTPRFDGARDPQGFFPRLCAQGVLVLAPLVNLAAARSTRLRLMAFPLRIRGACASPCRAVLLEEEPGDST